MGLLEQRVDRLESQTVMREEFLADKKAKDAKLHELHEITQFGRIEVLSDNIADVRKVQNKHTAILERHTKQLDQLTLDVAGLTTDVAGLTTDMTWVKSALGEVLDRLPSKPHDPSEN